MNISIRIELFHVHVVVLQVVWTTANYLFVFLDTSGALWITISEFTMMANFPPHVVLHELKHTFPCAASNGVWY